MLNWNEKQKANSLVDGIFMCTDIFFFPGSEGRREGGKKRGRGLVISGLEGRELSNIVVDEEKIVIKMVDMRYVVENCGIQIQVA